jgi:hypothetical protein
MKIELIYHKTGWNLPDPLHQGPPPEPKPASLGIKVTTEAAQYGVVGYPPDDSLAGLLDYLGVLADRFHQTVRRGDLEQLNLKQENLLNPAIGIVTPEEFR